MGAVAALGAVAAVAWSRPPQACAGACVRARGEQRWRDLSLRSMGPHPGRDLHTCPDRTTHPARPQTLRLITHILLQLYTAVHSYMPNIQLDKTSSPQGFAIASAGVAADASTLVRDRRLDTHVRAPQRHARARVTHDSDLADSRRNGQRAPAHGTREIRTRSRLPQGQRVRMQPQSHTRRVQCVH